MFFILRFIILGSNLKIFKMAFSDIYKTGGHKRNLGHFASIVKLALSDDTINEEEQKIISRMKRELHISDADYEKVLKAPNSFPINPPSDLNTRIERFFNLITLVTSDNHIGKAQVILLEKIAIGLGFEVKDSKKIVSKAINYVVEGHGLDEFLLEMKKRL